MNNVSEAAMVELENIKLKEEHLELITNYLRVQTVDEIIKNIPTEQPPQPIYVVGTIPRYRILERKLRAKGFPGEVSEHYLFVELAKIRTLVDKGRDAKKENPQLEPEEVEEPIDVPEVPVFMQQSTEIEFQEPATQEKIQPEEIQPPQLEEQPKRVSFFEEPKTPFKPFDYFSMTKIERKPVSDHLEAYQPGKVTPYSREDLSKLVDNMRGVLA